MRSLFSRPIFVTIVIFVLVALGAFAFFDLREKAPEASPAVRLPEEYRGLAKYKVIGTSVEGRKIESFTYEGGEGKEEEDRSGAGKSDGAKKHLVFVGGMHGGYEWNSVLLAYQFMDYLDKNLATVPDNLKVTVIPSLNPDGVYKVTGKVTTETGHFSAADVSDNKEILASGRFNANDVDLNRNFDCKWKPTGTWQNKTVSAGTKPFSEPEAAAFRDFVLENKPDAVIFWHSKASAVYASECKAGILPGTLDIMNAYAKASGYTPFKTFDSYEVTGDAEGWLASINIPAITVELKTHESIEWEKNLAGIKAIFDLY